MKILFALFTPRFSGAEKFIVNLVENNKEISSYVLCSPGYFKKGLTNCEEIFYSGSIKKLERNSSFLFALFRLTVMVPLLNIKTLYLIFKFNFQIIHVNNLTLASYIIPLAWLFKVTGCKTKFIWHDFDLTHKNNYEYYLTTVCYNVYSLTLVTSQAVANKYELKEKVKIIYGGIETCRFKRDNNLRDRKRNELNVGNRIVIGEFGVLSEGKGTKFLIDSITKMDNYKEKIFLLLIGRFDSEDFRSKVLDILQNNFEGSYKLIEWIENIEEYYNAVDIMINSTLRLLREPLGATILEAMSTSCLVLAPNRDGPAEIISDGENGFLFESDNADSFVERMKYLLNSHNSLSSVRDKARQTVIEKFDSIKMVRVFNHFINSLYENS